MNRNDIADIFEALGGKSGFIRWSKKSAKNLAQAYSMLGRSVLHDGIGDAATAKPDPKASGEEFSAMIQQTLDGIVAARARGDYDPSPKHVEVVAGAAHGDIPHTPHVIADTPEALIERPLLQSKPVTPKPDVRKRSEPIVPGAGAAQALNGRSDGQQPSATELFYEWNGHARPTWSPPRDWSGS